MGMNGVLLRRFGSHRERSELRPHLSVFIETLCELADQGQLLFAVWSSMMEKNLYPLVDAAFGERKSYLEFVWDQQWCTQRRVPGMHKPLLRKDLKWLSESAWWQYAPDHVLLIDDDSIKCTKNPEG